MKIFVVLLAMLAFSGCLDEELPESALISIEFGSQPGTVWDLITLENRVAFSPEETPTSALYDKPHDEATLHDLLEKWSLHHGTYNGTVGEFGFFLQDLNGIAGFYNDNGTSEYDDDSGAYWQIFIDGEASQEGISQIIAEDGMAVKFVFTTY